MSLLVARRPQAAPSPGRSPPAAAPPGPVALVAGGRGPAALHDTVAGLAGAQVRVAAATLDEALAVAGLASVEMLDPWPGARAAVARLARDESSRGTAAAVIAIAAGSRVARGKVDRAVALVERGAGLVVPARSRRQALGVRLRLRLFRHATVHPGSGIVMSGAALPRLSAWLAGARPSAKELRRAGGRIRVVRGLLTSGVAPRQAPAVTVTVLIAAHNEEAWIGESLRSIAASERRPDRVVVVDDGSTDRTGDIARALGARVVRPPHKTGRKASALNYGLQVVDTDAVVILDADTMLHPEAIGALLDDLADGKAATSGAVLPHGEHGFWARGRALEYSVAMRLHKPLQQSFRALMVLSGCIACYRTETLRSMGGFSERTVIEDIDATWTLHLSGAEIGYTPRALAYTVEPPTWDFYKAQMRRWASAFFQSFALHARNMRRRPALALIASATLWDIVTAPLLTGATVFWLATGRMELAWWFAFWPAVLVSVSFFCGATVVGVRRTLRAFPAFMTMLWTNLYFFCEALVREWVLRRKRLAWVKGH